MKDEIDTDGDGFISYEEFTNFSRANRGLVRDVAKIFKFLHIFHLRLIISLCYICCQQFYNVQSIVIVFVIYIYDVIVIDS
uniref:Polcalcin Aln g 4 n=1 Tax=Cajanus cajan TaxID=3821 RepID=A0A151U9D2_CAJCA|nr:Polcalcin Aln g 4 [Cajanus cajan]